MWPLHQDWVTDTQITFSVNHRNQMPTCQHEHQKSSKMENSSIWSTVPKAYTSLKLEGLKDAFPEIWPFDLCFRMSAILDFIPRKMAPLDPPTSKITPLKKHEVLPMNRCRAMAIWNFSIVQCQSVGLWVSVWLVARWSVVGHQYSYLFLRCYIHHFTTLCSSS